MPTPQDPDFDFLADLKNIRETSEQDSASASPKPSDGKASFQTEKMEDRVLFSATWMDLDTGDALDGASESDDGFTGTSGRDVVRAGGGNDLMDGLEGNDVLYGGEGNDVITGGQGNDLLRGENGDDTFVYREGDGTDRFQGGEGSDHVDATKANTLSVSHMTAGDSIESVEGSAEGTRIEGTDGYNHLNFTNTKLNNISEIDAGGGNDYVKGSQGDDVIIGGQGNDTLYGNGGDDTFVYREGDGSDRVLGGEGTDRIDATEASSLGLKHMVASDSIEVIEGSAEGTRIEGTEANNHLDFTNVELKNVTEIDAGDGNDRVKGSQGDDVIIGGQGNDTLYGNGGDDTFVYREGDGSDRMLGGEGTDRIDATEANSLGLKHLVARDSIEVIEGSAEGTRIEGTDGYNHLNFTDTKLNNVSEIDAGGGNDYVKGSQGDDVIIGGQGNDTLYGNGGDDTFVYREGDGSDRMLGGEGTDRIDATEASSLGLKHMVAKDSIEIIEGSVEGTRIEGTEGYNHLDFTNVELKNVSEIDAGDGNDRVKGSQGDDVIIGGQGNDTLYGNGGDDTFVYREGDGSDRMLGGEGTDRIDATEASSLGLKHLVAKDSIEIIEGSAEGTRIEGTDANNHLNFTDVELKNVTEIDAGGGNDYVKGSQGDDVIIGGQGNDNLYGNAGDDTFVYSEGDGNDRMRGGEGTDTIDATGATTLDLTHVTATDSIEAIEGSQEGTRIEGTDGYNHLNFSNTELTNITEIDAGAGNDYVKGSQSDDVIIGGQGNDNLYGNAGDDTFVYSEGDGNDRMRGGEGTDTIDATGATTLDLTHVTAADSIEAVEGSQEGTRIEGTDGYNHLNFSNTELTNITEIDAGAGNDYVKGSQSDDIIIGGQGNDNLYGNAGDDTFVYSEGDGNDRMRGGEGLDTVDATSASTLGLSHMTAADSIEAIEGSQEGTRIQGTDGYNHLNFSNTDLTNITEIDAGAGNDYVKGSQSDDVIIGGQGNDRLYGNAGDDTFVYNEGDGADRMVGGEGFDQVDATGASSIGFSHMTASDSIESIEGSSEGTRIEGTEGNNHLNFTNIELSNITAIDAGAGDDVVIGSRGNDVFIAGEGNDRIIGNGGDDVVLFNGNRADYEITNLGNGLFAVEDLREGASEGRDVINLIENFQFADGHADVGSDVEFTANSLQMSGGTVVENSEAGIVVATFGADSSFGESHTYEIVDAEGNVIEHSQFEVVDNQILVKADADLNFEEVDKVELQVRSTSAEGVQYTTSVAIEVTDINDAPTVFSFSANMQEDGVFNGNLLTEASDEDGDALKIVGNSQPEHGTLVVNEDGGFTYQPNENFSGTDTFTYEVSDENGATVTETVTIEVAAVVDGVELEAAEARGQENEPIALDFNLSLIDGDGSESVSQVVIQGVPLSAELSAGVQLDNGNWVLSANELAGLELQLDGFGNDSFDLTIEITTEDGDETKTQTKTIEVNVLNDALNTRLAIEAQNATELEQVGPLEGEKASADSESKAEVFAGEESLKKSVFDTFAMSSELDFNGDSGDQKDLWNDDRWKQFSDDDASVGSNKGESEEVASVDETYLNELNQLEFFDPSQLVASEAAEFENDQLMNQPIQVEGWETFELPLESLGTQNLTTASLLMLFTTREDKRVKVKTLKSLKGEGDPVPSK